MDLAGAEAYVNAVGQPPNKTQPGPNPHPSAKKRLFCPTTPAKSKLPRWQGSSPVTEHATVAAAAPSRTGSSTSILEPSDMELSNPTLDSLTTAPAAVAEERVVAGSGADVAEISLSKAGPTPSPSGVTEDELVEGSSAAIRR